MAAGKHTRLKNHLAFENGKRILKGGVLFGANASGKSNLLKAMAYLVFMVDECMFV
ncbi:MAG: ATP-binding protein [Lachnospiraceae bacterium]|nr:ATP-binding protein [Lachnospiraceae bacterium]